MSLMKDFVDVDSNRLRGARSHSAQGLATITSSPAMKIPLPPKMWITDIEDESSDEVDGSVRDEGVVVERQRMRSRFRHHKSRSTSVPIGIFWDIENCQVPRGCSAIDVVAAIRAKFLPGRREADFVVVCDVRKEAANRLQELNDAQVSLIHVCGTQKNAADEKLRQCMRRFGELHTAPAALLLISGDINFAADLSDFRHRKNMEVILVHKQNTSSALIACASSHYCYNQLTASLPRKTKSVSQSKEEEEDNIEPACEMEVCNLPLDQAPERITKRLRRLADNCGGKVLKINLTTATMRFPTPDHASRALKRMDGEDVFGRKISTRYARQPPPAYSSDEGYSTAPAHHAASPPFYMPPAPQVQNNEPAPAVSSENAWARALQQLPTPAPPPLHFCPPPAPAPKPRKIRGTHGSVNLDRSGWSSSNSGDDSRRAASPWNSSASFSEHSEPDDTADLTVSNLPAYDAALLQEMLTQLFSQYVSVVRVSVWAGGEGPVAAVTLRSEWDARLAIARVHKRRLEQQWHGRRLELALGRPSPAPNLDVLRARLRTILLEHKGHTLPLLRLRDAYASRHSCALTTSDLAKLKDTVVVHEGFGRMVQLVDLRPVSSAEMEEAPWKCQLHAALASVHEDGRMLQPVYIEADALEANVKQLLESHGGVLPLLSFVECYEASFPPLLVEPRHGVPLELLLRSATSFEVRDAPSRHLTWRSDRALSPPHDYTSESSRCSGERGGARTAPALEPMLALLERELLDLLRTAPRCQLPFSKLIPAFHHHFGRQCRVADYGFTKLPDLLAALSNTIVVLGSGSSRVITLSAAAQTRRFTADLVKLLKAQAGRPLPPHHIPAVYESVTGRPLVAAEYGACSLAELLARVPAAAVAVRPDGALALPRQHPNTPADHARTKLFAAEAIELLCHTPNLRMELSRFVPAYHAHFGRQLRVGNYGCGKLAELLELVPEAVCVAPDGDGERTVRLAPRAARPVLAARLRTLAGSSLQDLPVLYARQYGAPPAADMLEAQNIEDLVYAAGGCVEEGRMVIGGGAAAWSSACLAAAAVLCADRSVARGSTRDYFHGAYRRVTGAAPDVRRLAAAGVLAAHDQRLALTPAWRAVCRLAQILASEPAPLTAHELAVHYTERYEPTLPSGTSGAEGVCAVVRAYSEVFVERGARWALAGGVRAPRVLPACPPPPHDDYSVHDTPPGQKGSRVWESPRGAWSSPPASALPPPSALLSHDKRRTRLAAQFDAS